MNDNEEWGEIEPVETDADDFGAVEPLRWEDGDGGSEKLPDGEHNQWGGNLRNDGRRVLFRRDKDGKVNGYSTTSSMLVRHDDGKFAVVPTVVGGKELSQEEAVKHYAETGEHWGMADDEESAQKMAQEVHDTHMKGNQAKWNDWLHEHWDEVSDDIRNDRGMAYEHENRTAPDKTQIVSKEAAAAKGEMGITETAQKDYEAATGAEAPENPILAQIANMGLTVGGRLNANLQMQAAQKLAAGGNYDDRDMDDLMDQMVYGGVKKANDATRTVPSVAGPGAMVSMAFHRTPDPVPNEIMKNWDESEGRRIADPEERRIARMEYARQIATDFIKERSAVRQNAETELQNREATHTANVVSRGLGMLGYTAPYMLGPVGIGLQFLEEGAANAVGYANDEYGYDGDGRFRIVAEGDDAGRAALAGFGTAGIETATEIVGGKIGGALAKRGAKTLGRLVVGNKAAEAIGAGVGKLAGKTAEALGKTKAGRATLAFARGVGSAFKWTSRKMHLENPIEENIEEFESQQANSLLGWDKRRSELENLTDENGKPIDGVGARWWHDTKQFLKPGEILKLNEAMLLTMGGGAAVAHFANRSARKDVDNIIRKHGLMSEEELKTASLEDKVNAYKAWAADLSEDETARMIDEGTGAVDRLAERIAGSYGESRKRVNALREKMAERDDYNNGIELDRLQIPRQKFNIPMRQDGRGRNVPDFRQVTVDDADTGEKAQRNAVYDESGISIVDNGGEGDAAYIVFSPDGRASRDFPTLTQAVKFATQLKNAYALDLARDRMKQQFIANEYDENYRGAKNEIVDVKGVDDAVRLGVNLTGEDVSKDANFRRDRRGWRLKDGTVVLVRDNIASPGEVQRVMRHEIVGHDGRMMQGRWFESDEGSEIGRLRDANLKNAQENGPVTGRETRRVLRETVANVVQQRRHSADTIDKVVHAVRNALHDRGVDLKMNDTDLEVEVSRIEKELRHGDGDTHISVDGTIEKQEFREAEQSEANAEEKKEDANETGNVRDEAPAQPEQGAAEPAGGEAARPVEAQPQGGEAPRHGAVEAAKTGAAEAPTAMKTERDFLRVMHDNQKPVRVPVGEIALPDTQFKEGADPKTGVVKGQELKGEYFESAENAVVVYVRKDGTKELVTGRHRFDLAKRNGKNDILARVFREADGYTPDDMRNLDAISNIIDEKGTEHDYIRYFENAKPSRAAAEAAGFLSRSKGRLAFELYEGATEGTRAAIDWSGSGADGLISPEQAGIIAKAAPRDAHPRNGAVQRILVKKAQDGLRGDRLAIVARSLAEEAKRRKAPAADGETQLDLFASEEDLALLALEEKRAARRVQKANEYGRVAGVLQTAMQKGGRLDLNKAYAKELGIKNPKDRKQLADARQKALEKAEYWRNAVRLDEADKAALDAELGAAEEPQAEGPKAATKADASRTETAEGKPTVRAGEPPAQKPAENAPASAPKKAGATARPKAAKPVEGRKSGDAAVVRENLTTEKPAKPVEDGKPLKVGGVPIENAHHKVTVEIEENGRKITKRVTPEEAEKMGVQMTAKLETVPESAKRAVTKEQRDAFAEWRKNNPNARIHAIYLRKDGDLSFGYEDASGNAYSAYIFGDGTRKNATQLHVNWKNFDEIHGKNAVAIDENALNRSEPATRQESRQVAAPSKTKTPSVRMKDEAAERKAKAALDAIDFDSPELDTVVSGDEVRKTMPGYNRLDWSTHVDRTGYVGPRLEAQFQRLLKERKGKGDGTVVFLAGGNGAGKSTVAAKIGNSHDFTIDSTLGNLEVAKKQIDAILANGQTPEIHFVYRTTGQALEGIAQRVKNGGHIVSPLSFANSHVKSRENLRLLSDAYGDKIRIHIYDNSVDGAPEITLEQLEAKGKPGHERIRESANYYLGHLREREEARSRSQGGVAGGGAKGEASQVDFDSPDFDPERFGKLVTGVGKLVDVLVESGHREFKALATYIYERDAAKYGRAKPVLQDIWNAVARARGLSRVGDAEAERVFGIIEAQDKEATDGRELQPRRSSRVDSDGGTTRSRDNGNGPDAGVSAAGRGAENSGGVLAGGRVRTESSDGGVGGVGAGSVPGRAEGRADSGNAEVLQGRGSAGGETAPGNGAVGDSVRPEGSELQDVADNRGDGHNPKLRVKKSSKKAADKTKVNPSRRDFVMTEAVEKAIVEKGTADRVRNNLAAIRLIRDLKARDYVATPEEQETLAKFVGWGGLREKVFGYALERAYDLERTGERDRAVSLLRREGVSQSAYDLHKELRSVLNDSEYESAKASASTAFYTPVEFVRVLHDALRRLGVKGGRFLGPSAGTGNFASAAGQYEKPVNWQFVERDVMTGEMLKALFPNQRVTVGGFEDTKFPDGFFDFAIDNVPYADVPINDRSLSSKMFKIHDYFFAKTLAKLRPGGVMAFLTSTGTLDKASPLLRQFLTEHGGRIVGAVRLPNGFFAENAGTDVASDLVIVQKMSGRPDNSAFERSETYKTETGSYNRKTHQYGRRPVGYNGYFKDNPGQVIGKMEVASGQFGPTLKYTMPENADEMLMRIGGAIDRALDGIDKDALLKSATVSKPQDVHAPVYDEEGLRQGNVTMKDGKPFIKSGDILETMELPKGRKLSKELAKRLRTPKQIMEGLIGLRTAMRDVIDAQMSDSDIAETDLTPLFAKLNEVYDAFVKKNGSLHDKWVSPFALLDKADGNRLLALERVVEDENGKPKIVKSDIFYKRVISRGQKATKADTPKDALVICYSENGGINVPRVAELLGVDADEAVQKLKESGDVFENPQTGLLEPSWEYLSGRVRAKLAAARAAVDAGEESYRANVEALEKVQPPMVRLEDAEIKFGATWVDPECMKDFLRDAFGSENMRIALGKNEVTGQWNVELGRVMNEAPWGETSWDLKEFVSRVLNHGSMNHYVTDPVDKKRYLDERRTEANKLAAEKLHHAFSQFIQSSETWAAPCYERYNAVMTDMVEISLPNNILPFRSAGMSEATLGKLFEGGDPKTPKKGREYQSAAIARGVLGGGSLCLAHCVGAGKTLEMQSIGVLGRHLGLFKKPMYVVPNHMLEQFTNEFVEAFPNANILKMSEDDVKPVNRRAFFAQVANGDWDAIVVKHSTFSTKLAMSDEYQKRFLDAQINDMDAAIEAMREAGERISVDQATKKKDKLKAKLEKLINAENHDSEIVPFEELGVDQLFVDEAHNFKGMEITTRQGRTGGLSQGDSQRAVDMQMKTQYVQSLHGGDRGVVFATGTPLSNAPVVEAYVMLKYLAPSKLQEQGLEHFDDFVDAFGRITTESIPNNDGKTFKEKDAVTAFVNTPEMMKLFRSVVDIVNADQLDIERPKPKYHMIDVDMTPAQEAIMETIARIAPLPTPKEWRSKHLDTAWVAKLACLSPKLLGIDETGNKILRAVSEIKKVYDETADNRGAQLVFTDRFEIGYENAAARVLGESGTADFGRIAKFNLNEEIRDLLVQAGIPKDEIAIIQDIDKSKGDKDANKSELFDKVRSGEVRVLIGSRPKMGEGTNVQERLAAIHLLHPGWKPAEDEQAIGRIIRYGNTYKEGQIFYYITKGNANVGSYEMKNHDLIGRKSKLIDQVMHGDETVREVEMDESAMDRDMLMGLASGNKALMELIDVKKRVHKLELNTESTMTSARRNKDKAEANARILERRREEFAKEQEGVKEWREKNDGKPFTLSTPDGRSIEKVKDMANMSPRR